MYTTRVQLANYGPIEKLEIDLTFEGESPKPVLLVGGNGSGKSILLSHVVNGLIEAKGEAYPETPEVELGKVYKVRSNSYIKSDNEYSFGRVDFEGGYFVSELTLLRNKREFSEPPRGVSGTAIEDLWTKMSQTQNSYYDSSIHSDSGAVTVIKDKFEKNCVLYFPSNRFEEPAWLNEQNLKAQAQFVERKGFAGHTDRQVIAFSPLRENQNWLFDVIYDRVTIETQTVRVPVQAHDAVGHVALPIQIGPTGRATSMYEIATQIVRRVMTKERTAGFRIGQRRNRVLSLANDHGEVVPNIFQLSSGETALLNLFLSILRDFDSCDSPVTGAADIRGIVVVDEIDLHLHAVHQREVLPDLLRMFPKVQFIMTTHSPLFVLGMQAAFGDDGFALYRLPHGERISPEEFSEFGDAYRAFTATTQFSGDIRAAIEGARRPIVFVEGASDQKYLQNALKLLGKESTVPRFELRDGGGSGNLVKIWKNSALPLTEAMPQKMLLLFDCDKERLTDNRGKLSQRTIPLQAQNPVKKGIENLFSDETLEKARRINPAFIDIDPGRTKTVRGEPRPVPDEWTVNEHEKANLCQWLCEYGTREDFERFQVILELIEEVLEPAPESIAVIQTESSP